jgi:hypothetical protein
VTTPTPRIPTAPARLPAGELPGPLGRVWDGLVLNREVDLYAGYADGIRTGWNVLRKGVELVRALDPVTADLVRIRTAQLDGCHR